jgi:hypothetical protein
VGLTEWNSNGFVQILTETGKTFKNSIYSSINEKKFIVLESVEMRLTLAMSHSLQFSFHKHELEASGNLLKSTKLDTMQKKHEIHYSHTRAVKLLLKYRREQ